MKITRTFKLERPTRKGGDWYEEQVSVGELPIMGSTYVNQSVSRDTGNPAPELKITIETSD